MLRMWCCLFMKVMKNVENVGMFIHESDGEMWGCLFMKVTENVVMCIHESDGEC